ncbi:hypothetical protein ES695_01805 [Candidatus Atribacteria bacterium 1244-E10-H5-B2]|nr:MAG: hypothetical protein ES695_01805 [Candidatus Atribacteria bacterium 1244-E10-H5-B2]
MVFDLFNTACVADIIIVVDSAIINGYKFREWLNETPSVKRLPERVKKKTKKIKKKITRKRKKRK